MAGGIDANTPLKRALVLAMVTMATMMADDDVFGPQNGTEQYCQFQVYNANLFCVMLIMLLAWPRIKLTLQMAS